MTHFGDLYQEFDELIHWADLRFEQGADCGKLLGRLRKEMRAAKGGLVRAGPAPAVTADEPNALGEIRARRQKGPRRLWDRFDARRYRPRLRGAWLARAAGCTLGAPVEGASVEDMAKLARYAKTDFPPTDYWTVVSHPHRVRYQIEPMTAYTPDGMRHIPVDDDLTYTLLGLLILEDYGPQFTTADVGEAWVKYLPLACTAERVALENLRSRVGWRQSGVKGNYYMEYIGADIRADAWGYAAAGWPEKAAELAYRDAYLSHRHNGIYGEMYFAAAIAAAFAVDDPLDACRTALTEIPRRCRLHKDLTWALRQAGRVRDYAHARGLVDRRFPGMSKVHTNNNACLTIFGLALGGRDVTKVLGNTVAMGMDNDCTAATAGSIVGAVVGAPAVPKHWIRPFRNKARTYINGHQWFTNSDIVRRFTDAARAVWAGGT